MSKPNQRFLNRLDRLRRRQGRPAQHDDRDCERTRRRDLAVAGVPAAIFGDQNVDSAPLEQRAFILRAERAAHRQIFGTRQLEWRRNWIDAADDIVMLRRRHEGRELLATHCQKYAARQLSQLARGFRHCADLLPAVTFLLDPWRPTQHQEADIGEPRSLDRVARDLHGEGMGCVNERADALRCEIIGKPPCAAKPADAEWDRSADRRRGPARKRQGDGGALAIREALSEVPCFRCAAENEDAHAF